MTLSFRQDLEQLAHIKSSEYLSTQPGLTGVPVLGGALYKHTALSGLLGGKVPCATDEKEQITSIIKQFLEQVEKNFESKDIPFLTDIDYLMRRMGADERGEIKTIYKRVWEKALTAEPRIKPEQAVLVEEENLALEVQPSTIAPLSPLNASVVEIPSLYTGELAEAARGVNTCFILELPLTNETRADCEKISSALYQKSLTQFPLSDDEWLALGRSLYLLMKEAPSEISVKMAQEIFLRFYIKEKRSTSLPEEFFSLFKLISNDSSLRNKIAFLRTATLPSSIDPNAAAALQTLLEQYAAFRWEDNPITITKFPSDQPWREEGEEKTDQEILQQLCHTIDKTTLVDHLDTVTLILLFALSSHTFRETVAFRKDFRKLAKHFPDLIKTLGQTPPHDAQEAARYNNFRRLYQFFVGSRFLTRMEEEERAKSSVAKDKEKEKEPVHIGVGERYSLWGFKGASRELAGNLKKNFDIPSLLNSLEEARQVALREAKQITKGRKPSLGERFTLQPSSLSPLEALQKFSWGELFHEPLPGEMWEQGVEQARRYAQQISEIFKSQLPPLDFEAIVKASQEGGPAFKRLLDTYADGGLVLLRDYVYPYVVLMRRATTPADNSAAKFIEGAVSAEEIAALGGETLETQVAILRNVLHLMRPAHGDDKGGFLKESVIGTNQVEMLAKMIGCIESGKTVSICNETGSGKTTMSKLAPEIVSLPVPMVLHVAPFPQSEKGWKRLTSWEQLSSLKNRETQHFWITAKDLSQLMENGIPKKHLAHLRKTFFLMDEYDSQAYSVLSKDASGAQTLSSIQDELFFQYGCPRVVNMSATPNLETLDNTIQHYTKKMEEISSSEGQEALVEYYRKKIETLTKTRQELISNITREWQRNIELKDLPEKDPAEQISFLFKDIQTFPKQKGTSLLVEMPEFTLTPEFTGVLEVKMSETFPDERSAILFRDSDGVTQAHFSKDGREWKTYSMEEFTKVYHSLVEKPQVVCFYAQDSVGGDFGIFSNERLVKGQFILYPGDIAPSYAIYQNMRRQRTSLSKQTEPSPTPVRFYLGPKAASLIEPSPEEINRISTLAPEEQASAHNLLKKEKLFAKSMVTAAQFSHTRELARLKKKVVRKKQHLLEEVLKVDVQTLSSLLEKSLGTLPSKQSAIFFLQSKIKTLVQDIPISFESNIEDLRKQVLAEALDTIHEPLLEPLTKEAALQENEAVLGLLEIFGGIEGLNAVAESADPYDEIQKVMTKYYGKRPDSCAALFSSPLQTIAKKKNDPILHPQPSLQAITGALQRIRGNAPAGVSGVDEAIEAGPVRVGVKPLPPDLMVKSLLGLAFHDKLGAKSFCNRLQKEASKALVFQEAQKKALEEMEITIDTAKKEVFESIENISEPTSLLKSVSSLSKDPAFPAIKEKAEKMDLYLDTHQLYAQISDVG